MFLRKRNADVRTPELPVSERGCSVHRVSLPDTDAVAYVFTTAKNLKGSVLHAANVAFVNPACGPDGEHNDVDAVTLDERQGDYDYHAARACLSMTLLQHKGTNPRDADKVVVFAQDDCPFAVIKTLCEQFGATNHPASKKVVPEMGTSGQYMVAASAQAPCTGRYHHAC